MRRNVRKLHWVLWLVILAFIAFYVPNLVQSPSNVVARVDGDPIYAEDYQQALQQQAAYYRSISQGDLPEDFLQQIQIGQIVLDSLIRQKLLVAAARDEGLSATPQEIKDRILQFDAFRDEQGRWVGDARYQQILRENGYPIEDFEQEIAQSIMLEKLTGLISESVSLTDAEVEDSYQRRNEMVQFDFFQLRPGDFLAEASAEVSEEEASAYFDSNKSDYRLPERRRVSYALLETEAVRDTIEIGDDVLRGEYEEKIDEFTVTEQIQARHILFRIDAGAAQEVSEARRAEAQAVLDEIRAGADFAEMAREHSDDSSASLGGDLGWFGRGRMTREFEDAAFALEVGETSDLVETPFGLHIIQVDSYRPEQVRSFEEVRGQLDQRLAWERAESMIAGQADEIRRAVLRRQSLGEIAEQFDLTVVESPLFDAITGLEEIRAPEFTRQAFNLGRGRVAEPVPGPQGHVIFSVDEIVESREPEFEDVEEEVRADVAADGAAQRAAAAAEAYGERLRAGESFSQIALEAGAAVQSTELIPRAGSVPEIGRQPSLTMAAFELNQGESGGPVAVDGGGFALFMVTNHVQPDWTQFGTQQGQLKEELLNQRRNNLFESMLRQLRERYTVELYEDVQQRIAGL
jgi:peptidyl-prolyl cis-trans isomerase D